MSALVRPLLRVLANGRRQIDGKNWLRFTVIATPELISDAGKPGDESQNFFELADWPKEMAQRLRDGVTPFDGKGKIVLRLREIVAGEIPPIGASWKAISLTASGEKAFGDAERWKVINRLWQGALGTPGRTDWEGLAKDIEQSLTGGKRKADLKEAYDDKAAPNVDRDGAILVNPLDSTKGVKISGIVPVRQSDFAIDEEGVRAARILAKQYGGPFAIFDDDPELRKPEVAEETVKIDGAADPEKKVDESPEARFRDTAKKADAERGVTQAANKFFKDVLMSGQGEKPALSKPADLIPPAGDVVASQIASPASPGRDGRRATHQYGNWLQRRAAYATKALKDNPERGWDPPEVPDNPYEVPDSNLQKLRGIYFSLQGDPVLARLFCLAFDFEIEEKELGRETGLIDNKLHLAIAPLIGSTKPQVATAAWLSTNGFWPLSVFMSQIVKAGDQCDILCLETLVEQNHGIWKLGEKTTVRVDEKTTIEIPRYELASLDLRRSVDSKTTGRDRGEAHQTGGLTILDRGRAEQIARDLAIAEMQTEKIGNPDSIIVLHAEELTVGRHVDVAAAKAGTPIKDLAWRSLMQRYVNFNFADADKVVEGVLEQLYPAEYSKMGLLEETSFQVAARFMPMSDVGSFEAVAEEAIFMWDGTPAGVLTDSRMGNETCDSLLGFGRELDLPGARSRHAGLRPPPLRFGVPYVLRCRSMFLGGGSPEASDPLTATATSDLHMVPAAQGGLAQPRRFLRQESIAAPVLMLPKHLAEARNDYMGYAQADQAIVRSWNTDPSGLKDVDNVKGTYIEGERRSKPDKTMRVFVAPEAPFDLVVRHGMLDKGNAAAIRRGGLLNVTYTPRPLKITDPPKDAAPDLSGFPVAVTARRDTLDKEGAIYRRTLAPLKESAESGIPVFEPGGTNSTKIGQIGYLPDPAIEIYCIRARIRGSDRYLAGAIEVKLYDGSTYPHALPLVITVGKDGKDPRTPRKLQPTNISQIQLSNKPAWLANNGTSSASKPAGGTRVQHVEIALYPGEDFDLEVTCLPSAKALADLFSAPETMAMQLQFASKDEVARKQITDICGNEIDKSCKLDANTQALTGLGGGAVPAKPIVDSVAARLFQAMKENWPIEEISAVTTLRACHAVNKPAIAAQWATKKVETFRPKEQIDCRELVLPDLKSVFKNDAEATDLFLMGKVALDLALVDSFQIIAETVAIDGARLDDRDRGRSMISKRSGRWPVFIKPDGNRAYVPPEDVLGFEVADDGTVTLPRRSVTLLNVGNLPNHGAVGEILSLVEDPEKKICALDTVTQPRQEPPGLPVFNKTENRMTPIEIGYLFAAASRSAPVMQQIAMQPGAKDGAQRTRQLKIERPFVFKDTLARKLKLSLVSVSRFAAAFETAPAYLDGREQVLHRRQPLKRIDQAVLDINAVNVWMQSTRRPATPEMRRPEPSFVITRASALTEKGDVRHSFIRRALTRFYLGRGWYSSGEGERLGIVLWPPQYRQLNEKDIDKDKIKLDDRSLELRDFEDTDLGDGGAFGTRWGGDPIREDKSPQSGYFIPVEAFADFTRLYKGPHFPEFQDSVKMPIPQAEPSNSGEKKPPEFLDVSLLTFEPCFDLDREEWYVDVDLKPIRASEPFVRFGLVRYQHESVSNDLKVSVPVTVSTQLLPERTVEITEEKQPRSADHRMSIKVKGLGSTDIKDLFPATSLAGSDSDKQKWQENFDRLRRPKIELAIFHERWDAYGDLIRTPVTPQGLNGSLVEEDMQFTLGEPKLENTTLVWSAEFKIMHDQLQDLGDGLIAAYLEEIDLRMPASYRSEPIQPQAMFATNTFIASGPRFSARIVFLQLGENNIEAKQFVNDVVPVK